VVCPIERKVQQGGAKPGESESTTKERDSQKKIRRIFKMLREVWLNIRIEKIDTYEGIIVKALLDSGTMEMFIDKRTTTKHGFKL